jgi:hypothetical protein
MAREEPDDRSLPADAVIDLSNKGLHEYAPLGKPQPAVVLKLRGNRIRKLPAK